MLAWCTKCGNPIVRGGRADFVHDMAGGGFKHVRCEAKAVVDDLMDEVRARLARNWRDALSDKSRGKR